MIHNLKTAIIFHWKLWLAKHHRESVLNDIDAQTKRAKTENEREEIWQSNQWDIDISQQAVQQLQTGYYGDLARRKGIPTPNRAKDWERLISTQDVRILTVDAIAQLRSRLRQEHKELRDVVLPYAAIIISVAALIVAFLNYHKPTPQQPITQAQPARATASPAPSSLPAPATAPNQPKPHQSKPDKAGH